MASGVSSIYEKGSEADGSIFIGILTMLVSGICAAIVTAKILGRKHRRDKTTSTQEKEDLLELIGLRKTFANGFTAVKGLNVKMYTG